MRVSRGEVIEVIDRLLSGEIAREEAAVWAGRRHVHEMADPLVEEALDLLTLVDARQYSDENLDVEVGYLYDLEPLATMRLLLKGNGRS